jgi:alpha-tubulin suppressor-like RCC1 family protein
MMTSPMRRAFTYALPSIRINLTSNFGQLGRDEFPLATQVLNSVSLGACGLLHTLLHSNHNGILYSFGKAAGGRLGNGNDLVDCFRPHPSVKLEGKVKAMAAGAAHSCLITQNGDLLAWGYDSVSLCVGVCASDGLILISMDKLDV